MEIGTEYGTNFVRLAIFLIYYRNSYPILMKQLEYNQIKGYSEWCE
jgi:hypothetical protein